MNNADGTYVPSSNGKETVNRTLFREVMEVEKKPSSMAFTVQMEVAETMEIV